MVNLNHYEIPDARFARLFNGNAHAGGRFTGCRWAEGPSYFAAKPMVRRELLVE